MIYVLLVFKFLFLLMSVKSSLHVIDALANDKRIDSASLWIFSVCVSAFVFLQWIV